MPGHNDFIKTIPAELPLATRQALRRYFENHTRPGGFVTAVLENDFVDAILKADDVNINHLRILAWWLYDQAPARAWGSMEKVERWLGERP